MGILDRISHRSLVRFGYYEIPISFIIPKFLAKVFAFA